SYQETTTINFDGLTALIGKNDVWKSTILEALEIFFNDDMVSMDQNDLNIHAKEENSQEIHISCLFTDLPDELIIDSSAHTNLREEHLSFIDDGIEQIEIIKKYNASKKRCTSETFIKGSQYPIKSDYDDLHTLTITKLKSRAKKLEVDLSDIDKRKSPELRKAIWQHGNLTESEYGVSLVSADKDTYGKKIWKSLEKYLPMYALFQSDRPSSDQDDEVQ